MLGEIPFPISDCLKNFPKTMSSPELILIKQMLTPPLPRGSEDPKTPGPKFTIPIAHFDLKPANSRFLTTHRCGFFATKLTMEQFLLEVVIPRSMQGSTS